ncbi:hypothetical protein K7432_009861 [Basidiobolus ranarum]|uniref:PH domain-containing protein n=1 Tax=Basidiobolus ranarum TaxID=34480 RepID=A0ABR2WPQ4_9FUNG
MFSRFKHSIRTREERPKESIASNIDSLFTFHSLPSKTLQSPALQNPPERAKSVHYLRASSIKLDNNVLDWVYDRNQQKRHTLPPPIREEEKTPEERRDSRVPRRRRKRRSSFPPAIFSPATSVNSPPKEGLLYIRVLEVRSHQSKKDYSLRCVLRVGAKECSTATVTAVKKDTEVQISSFDEIFLYDVNAAFTLYVSVFGQRIRKSSRRSSFFPKAFSRKQHEKSDVVVGSLQLSFPLQQQEKSIDTYFLDQDHPSDSKKIEVVLEVGMQFLGTKELDSDSDSDDVSKNHLHFGHLQLYIRDVSGSSNWESYFVALRNNKLVLYHPRHKSAKPPINEVDLSGMSSIRAQDLQDTKMHSFELSFPDSVISTQGFPADMIRGPGSEYKLYLSAPTESTRNIWLEKISDLLEDPSIKHQGTSSIDSQYLW